MINRWMPDIQTVMVADRKCNLVIFPNPSKKGPKRLSWGYVREVITGQQISWFGVGEKSWIRCCSCGAPINKGGGYGFGHDKCMACGNEEELNAPKFQPISAEQSRHIESIWDSFRSPNDR